mmetsp:Transcript_9562/g.17431  ORF Transcript_9562/g.17431 Transcript_9562/m.17431 type:complete len:213 (+) Transcript_9562:131-769(+)
MLRGTRGRNKHKWGMLTDWPFLHAEPLCARLGLRCLVRLNDDGFSDGLFHFKEQGPLVHVFRSDMIEVPTLDHVQQEVLGNQVRNRQRLPAEERTSTLLDHLGKAVHVGLQPAVGVLLTLRLLHLGIGILGTLCQRVLTYVHDNVSCKSRFRVRRVEARAAKFRCIARHRDRLRVDFSRRSFELWQASAVFACLLCLSELRASDAGVLPQDA